jgi:polar amino acid transport system substrate-binding protein
MGYFKNSLLSIDFGSWPNLRILSLGVLLSVFSNLSTAIELRVSVAQGLPPYIIYEKNRGMELDIVRESLALKGHSIKTVYLPKKRVSTAFGKGKVDAALTVNESSSIKTAHYSDSYITYQNVVIALAENNFTIDKVNDLDGYSVVGFQRATLFLGKEFASMAKRNSKYSERVDQSLQISLLFSKRTDLVVMDTNIYKYYKNLETIVDVNQPVTIFEIFPPSYYKVAFRDKTIKKDFNEGLRVLRSSGRYQEIIRSYTD